MCERRSKTGARAGRKREHLGKLAGWGGGGHGCGLGGPSGAGVCVVEPVVGALGFDDPAGVGEPVEGGAGEAFGAEHFRPRLEREVGGHDEAGALVRGGDHVEKQLGADLGGGHVAQLVEDQQVQLGERGFEPAEGAFVAASIRVVTSSVTRKNRTR